MLPDSSQSAGKAFFVSKHWEWFEKQVNLAEIEMAEADGEHAYDDE